MAGSRRLADSGVQVRSRAPDGAPDPPPTDQRLLLRRCPKLHSILVVVDVEDRHSARESRRTPASSALADGTISAGPERLLDHPAPRQTAALATGRHGAAVPAGRRAVPTDVARPAQLSFEPPEADVPPDSDQHASGALGSAHNSGFALLPRKCH